MSGQSRLFARTGAGGALAAVALFVLALFSAVPEGAEALTIEEIKAYCASLPNSTLVIGMVTKGNAELTLQRWRPTFDTYLTNGLSSYGCKTKLVPLSFDDYTNKTRDKEIDFIFPNPTAFQEMKEMYDIHEFLSVKRNFGGNQQLDRFGGVIVRSSTRFTDVINLADINKHEKVTVCGVNPNAFGGWQIQLYEMILQGVELSRVTPVFKGKHELSLNASIVDKTCDFAVARTETLERQVGLGEYAEADFFTVGEKGPSLNFPQHLSTVLYPEWPLASLAHVPRAIEQVIAVPLLTISQNSSEAQAGNYAGFAFPYSYEPVRKMFIGIDKDGSGRCDPGYKRVGTDPGLCEACVAGSFSTDGKSKQCELCPLGTINNGTANVDCKFCPEGLTTEALGSTTLSMCVAKKDKKQDDQTIATSIGAGIAVLVLGAVLCYIVYRNSAGVWDIFISIVSDFFLTMVSFGFEIIDILTDWFAYLQLIELKYSSTHPDLFTAYTVLIATSTIVSIANVVVRLVVAYKMSTEATTLSNARNKKKAKLGAADGLKGGDSSNSVSTGDLTVNARMNLSDMAQLGAVNSSGDVTEEMLYRMDLDELVGNGITVKRLLLTRQMSLAVAILEDIPMIVLNTIVLEQDHNQIIMVATFFSCILLGNKMYPLKQTFKLRQMDNMIRKVIFKRNAELAMMNGPKGGGVTGDLESHPVDKNGVAHVAAGGAGASAAAAGGVILMM